LETFAPPLNMSRRSLLTRHEQCLFHEFSCLFVSSDFSGSSLITVEPLNLPPQFQVKVSSVTAARRKSLQLHGP
jgi:hypothetical protein